VRGEDLYGLARRTGHRPPRVDVDYDWTAMLDGFQEEILAPPPDHTKFFEGVNAVMNDFVAEAGPGAEVFVNDGALKPPPAPLRPSPEECAAVFQRARAVVEKFRGPPHGNVFARQAVGSISQM
jgi:hypothetical protein